MAVAANPATSFGWHPAHWCAAQHCGAIIANSAIAAVQRDPFRHPNTSMSGGLSKLDNRGFATGKQQSGPRQRHFRAAIQNLFEGESGL